MWGKPPFSISDGYAIDVRNLTAAREWYKEKLGLHDSKTAREDDSRRPFVDPHISSSDELLSLVELAQGAAVKGRHVIFFAKKLEKASQWLAQRGVAEEPLVSDASGNRYLRFLDLDGNKIEVALNRDRYLGGVLWGSLL